MGASSGGEITRLLNNARGGDSQERLATLVHAELRQIAGRIMGSENPANTLQPTLLANDAYMGLVGHENQHWMSRAHFFGVAAFSMRRMLVDHSRKKSAQKRGGMMHRVAEVDEVAASIQDPETVLAIDQALTRLAEIDPRQAKVVEMRYYGGLTEDEIAEVWNLSSRTVKRDWESARLWLNAELSRLPTKPVA